MRAGISAFSYCGGGVVCYRRCRDFCHYRSSRTIACYRRNILVVLMSVELMLLAVNMNFVAFSRFLDDIHGQVFVFFILTVAAAESAIGLAILIVAFRKRGSINIDDWKDLRG